MDKIGIIIAITIMVIQLVVYALGYLNLHDFLLNVGAFWAGYIVVTLINKWVVS